MYGLVGGGLVDLFHVSVEPEFHGLPSAGTPSTFETPRTERREDAMSILGGEGRSTHQVGTEVEEERKGRKTTTVVVSDEG